MYKEKIEIIIGHLFAVKSNKGIHFFVENIRFYVSRDTRDLLTSADPHVHPIRIICISSTREHHYQENEWLFIDVGLKLLKL